MTERELRNAYARMLAGREPRERSACVAPEQLQALAQGQAAEERSGWWRAGGGQAEQAPERLGGGTDGRLTEAAREDALRHVASCPACQRDLDLLRAVVAAGRRLRRRRTMSLALAASVAVLLAGAALWSLALAPGARREAMRGAPEPITLLGPVGPVPAGRPVVLTWRPLPRALQYRVFVVDPDGDSVLRATTPDSTLGMTVDSLFRPGVEYRWWVQADLSDGTRPRSAVRRFHLVAR